MTDDDTIEWAEIRLTVRISADGRDAAVMSSDVTAAAEHAAEHAEAFLIGRCGEGVKVETIG